MAKYSTRYDYGKNIHVFVLDQTKPEDRVFKLTPRDTLEKINEIMIMRLPDGMLGELKEAAKENNRSLNAEIIARLEDYQDSQSNSDRLDDIRQTLIKHDEKVDKLTDMLGRICEVNHANTQRTQAFISKKLERNRKADQCTCRQPLRRLTRLSRLSS